MKYPLIILSLLVLGTGAMAQSPMHARPSFSSQDLLALVPGLEDKTPAELTLAERARLSDALSVHLQGEHYVARAAMSSFVLPGLGQFMIGKPLDGALFLAAQTAIVAGSMAGAYYLAPAGLLATWGDKSAMRTYMASGNFVQALPTMGVMAGGMTLALLNAVISSWSAAAGARENVASGQVKFQPRLMHSPMGIGFGFGL
jgi:hypothetical protein